VEEKTRNRVRTNVKWIQERRQWQTTTVQLNLPRKSSVGSPGV
jgi:hypothetical protein